MSDDYKEIDYSIWKTDNKSEYSEHYALEIFMPELGKYLVRGVEVKNKKIIYIGKVVIHPDGWIYRANAPQWILFIPEQNKADANFRRYINKFPSIMQIAPAHSHQHMSGRSPAYRWDTHIRLVHA